jgi:hypothetical protein
MRMPRDAVLLRIFVGENDRAGHRPLYEAIVLKARERHLAGATVLRGPMGFGRSSVLHTRSWAAAWSRSRRFRSSNTAGTKNRSGSVQNGASAGSRPS